VEEQDAQTVDIERYVRILWSNAWIVVLTTALIAGAVYAWSSSQPNVFQGVALVRVFDPSDPSVSTGGIHVDPAREVDIQVLYAQSPEVVAEFRRRMGSAAAQIQSTAVSAVSTADVMTVAVDSKSKKLAQSGASTYAQAYVDQQRAALAQRFGGQAATLRAEAANVQKQITTLDAQIAALEPTDGSHVEIQNSRPIVVPETDALRNLNTQRDSLATKYTDVLSQSAQADVDSGNRQADIAIVQQPAVPKQPISPLATRNTAIAGLAGLLLGLGLVALRYRLLQRVTTTAELKAAAPELPFVTGIPPNGSRRRRRREPTLDLVTSSDGLLAESYRTLRAGIRFTDSPTPLVLLVTSARAAEGKTTIAANLAVSLAQGGERVLVVDCDLRHPNIHAVFGMSNEVGLSTVVTKSRPLANAVRRVSVPGAVLDVLVAGPRTSNPAELLLTPAVATTLSEAKSRYDFVILDSPPILPVADALTLTRVVDGVLLVVRAKQTRISVLRQARLLLGRFDADVRGAVLVGAHHESTYGGYYYYAANRSEDKHRKRKHAARPGGPGPAPILRSSGVSLDQPSAPSSERAQVREDVGATATRAEAAPADNGETAPRKAASHTIKKHASPVVDKQVSPNGEATSTPRAELTEAVDGHSDSGS
jgi:capsular exopolysaccharide synthesis family protein